jgi:carboxyl-terminal processing protease
VKRKLPTMSVIALSTALTLHLTDQVARYTQESSLFVKPAVASTTSCPMNGELSTAFRPSGGLGTLIEAEPRGARLVSVLPGHAAAKAGLQLGDRIVSIDGVSTRGHDVYWMVSHLRGKIGTSVRLEVERGEGLWQRCFTVDLMRENIDVRHSVYSRVRDGELTLKVLWLDSSTAGQLANHLAQATRGDVTSVVLDLQNVSYGDTDAVAECASLFLPKGTPVGYMVSDRQHIKSVSSAITTSGHAMTDQLNAIEVGPYTARAGEMLARALANNLDLEVRGKATAGLGTLDGRTIRSRVYYDGDSLQLLDSQGRSLDGNPLKPSFWTWSHLLSSVPSGLE